MSIGLTILEKNENIQCKISTTKNETKISSVNMVKISGAKISKPRNTDNNNYFGKKRLIQCKFQLPKMKPKYLL